MIQAVWSTAHGDFLEVTDLSGEQISRLGAHFDPILAAFAPLWWVWPDPTLLLVVQAAAVALGALARVPARPQARRVGASRRSAFALAYLLYPPMQWLALMEFHPSRSRRRCCCWASGTSTRIGSLAFAVVAAVACLTKEHVGLMVAALGVWYALARGRRLAGAVDRRGRAATAALAIAVVVPHYAPGGGSPFEGRYGAVGGSPAGIAETRSPIRCSCGRDVRRPRRPLPPRAALAARRAAAPRPAAALTALPELAANLLSSTRTQTSIHFHYTAAAIPGLVAARSSARRGCGGAGGCGPPGGDGRGGRRPRRHTSSGAMPAWRHVPGGESLGAREHIVSRTRPGRRAACALIPDGAVVSATNSLGAHLSERRRAPQLPAPARRRRGSRSTRRGRATSTGSRRGDDASGCAGSGSTRAGGSSSTRTACSSSAKRLDGSSAGAGRRRARARRAAPFRSSSAAASGTAQTRYHGVSHGVTTSSRHPARARCGRPRSASRASSARPTTSDDAREPQREPVREPQLLEPVRERVARLLAGVAGERAERAQPAPAVLPRGECERRRPTVPANTAVRDATAGRCAHRAHAARRRRVEST